MTTDPPGPSTSQRTSLLPDQSCMLTPPSTLAEAGRRLGDDESSLKNPGNGWTRSERGRLGWAVEARGRRPPVEPDRELKQSKLMSRLQLADGRRWRRSGTGSLINGVHAGVEALLSVILHTLAVPR